MTLRKIPPARRRRNTDLIREAAEAAMGPLWVTPGDLYTAARQCARYGHTKGERVRFLEACGLLAYTSMPRTDLPVSSQAPAVAASRAEGLSATAGQAKVQRREGVG